MMATFLSTQSPLSEKLHKGECFHLTIAPICLLVSLIQLPYVKILTAKCGAVKEYRFWKVVMLYIELCPHE